MAEGTNKKVMISPATERYRYVGAHADNLANGLVIGIGDFVDLTDDDLEQSWNKELKDRGLLVKTNA